jgi:hypothetical protein
MKTDSILEQPTLNQVLQDRIDLMLLPAQACGHQQCRIISSTPLQQSSL